jgi:hypothetical protein
MIRPQQFGPDPVTHLDSNDNPERTAFRSRFPATSSTGSSRTPRIDRWGFDTVLIRLREVLRPLLLLGMSHIVSLYFMCPQKEDIL